MDSLIEPLVQALARLPLSRRQSALATGITSAIVLALGLTHAATR